MTSRFSRFSIFAVCAVLVTWPLAARFATHLPLGSLTARTVPLFNLWTLEWNAQRLAHAYAGYWDAPIFHPTRAAFALSEPEAVPGLMFASVAWAMGPIAAYNLTLLAILTLNGIAAQACLRAAGVVPLASLCAGVLTVGASFVAGELGVLQLSVLFPAFFVIAESCRFLREPAQRPLVRGALWYCALAWSCLYYAFFLGLLLLPAILLLRRRHLAPTNLFALAIAGVLSLTLLAPIALVQRRALAGFERSPSAVAHGSAALADYVRPSPRTLAARTGLFATSEPNARSLYPGAIVCALALFGLLRAARSAERGFALYCAACVLLALAGSLGTQLELCGFIPYVWLERLIPGLAQLRSPYRLAAFVQLFMIVLAGFGLGALAERVRSRRALSLVPLTTVLCLLDATPWSLPIAQAPSHAWSEPWVAWLHAHPGGAVALVPPAKSGNVRDYEPTVVAMLAGLRHGHPLVNGYSGFFPQSANRRARQLQRFPEQSSLQVLRAADVRYVVVENRWLRRVDRKRAIELSWPVVAARHRDHHHTIFELDSKR